MTISGMLLLRITQHVESQPDAYRVEVALEGDRLPRRTATARFSFRLADREQEELRWYLEEYLQHPADPAPEIAARVERRMTEIGERLFHDVFHADEDARELWVTMRDRLAETRIEIVAHIPQESAIPWELIRDPRTGAHLALRAAAFVRGHPTPAERVRLPSPESERIRVLVVICRPGGRADVPFRSVASRLIQGLHEDDRRLFELEVLRPPTYDALASRLRRAKAEGRPFHVVHFDGHGVWADAAELEKLRELLDDLSPHFLGGPRDGRHGYLVFEHPGREDNASLVDGPTLGQLLAETGVPVLVLNACRSAHAEPSNEPDAATSGNRHALVRTLGSLAQEVMDAGAGGVVAMRYNVYVATAAQFVADLYAALGGGAALGEAVTRGRKRLEAQPERSIAFDARPLQDWPVPVVYEAAPVALFPPRPRERHVELALGGTVSEDARLHEVPRRPDAGFFGRDETLLAIDRAFDVHAVVLVHAYAGSGKTTAVAEFARWYVVTGGAEHAVFTSFAQRTTLATALAVFGRAFDVDLRKSGVDWLTKTEAERRVLALAFLRQVPVLWIWDNVEPVAGFPAGTESAWSAAEQAELADFLRDARETKAKLLLTSRRDERVWLGDLPRRIEVPPMQMLERLQFARALGERYGKKVESETYQPLLRFTQGNPLALLVVVRQALRDRLATKEQVEAFVGKLRAGEKAFEDEAGEGRSKSLGASLAYGFEHAFSEEERRQVALLHLFQGVVNADALRAMGMYDADLCLAEIRGMTRDAWIVLLDRAAEVGVLSAYGGGGYGIHPAVPWFLKGLFDRFYPDDEEGSGALRAKLAYVEVMAALGHQCHNEYEQGKREHVAYLNDEETNLLQALRLARIHGQWNCVIGTMQGLRSLYQHMGRKVQWIVLVDEVMQAFVDPTTDGPLLEREEQWSFFNDYRVLLAQEAREFAKAERLQRASVEWGRRQADLDVPLERMNLAQRNRIRSLAVSVESLGNIQREQGDPACVSSYKEATDLYQRVGDRRGEAVVAYNLGNFYKRIRSFDDAESWYARSLKMTDRDHHHDRAKCIGQLGHVAFGRFEAALGAQRAKEEVFQLLTRARQHYLEALELFPREATLDVAAVHVALGRVYGCVGDVRRARDHCSNGIAYFEHAGDRFGAADARLAFAMALATDGRFDDARSYAEAALRNLEGCGDGAVDLRQEIERVLVRLEQAQGHRRT